MKEQNNPFGQVSRRKFLGSAATAAAALAVMPSLASSCTSASTGSTAGSKLNSKIAGVQMGTITYSFRNLDPGMEGILKACVESGCSSIELMYNGIEDWCGAPKAPARQQMAMPAAAPAAAGAAPAAAQARPAAPAPAAAPAGAPGAAPAGAPGAAPAGMPAGGFQRAPLTPEQQAAQDKYKADITAWRLNAPMAKFAELKKMFDDAGVSIHVVKWQPASWTDGEIDYAFTTAKALGAWGVSDELTLETAKRLGPFAEKHGMYASLHTHGQFGTDAFEQETLIPALAVSPAVMLNFDCGHFYGSTGIHPNTIIDKYRDRIKEIHLKDKTGPTTTPANANQVWGQGETPIIEILKKIRDEKIPYFCDIELEYPVAAWSTSVKEVAKCLRYAKEALLNE